MTTPAPDAFAIRAAYRKTRNMQTLALCGLGLLGGLMLFASDKPLGLWWLQLVAFIPLLWGIFRLKPSWSMAVVAGACFGAGYTAPLMHMLQFPFAPAIILEIYQSLLWVAFFAAVAIFTSLPPLRRIAAIAAAAVLVEWFDITVMPAWGTAQLFTRIWSDIPAAMQLGAWTGPLGLVFVVMAINASLALYAAESHHWKQALLSLAVVLLVWAAPLLQTTWVQPHDTVTVAAMGWTRDDTYAVRTTHPDRIMKDLYLPHLKKAVKQGATIIVSPEMGFNLKHDTKGPIKQQLAFLAQRYHVTLGVGYFDRDRDDNRLLFIGPDGSFLGEYVKTHLIYGLETYQPGDGSLQLHKAGNHLLGGMICQDDNFTDLSRALYLHGADIVAVPTYDWKQVAPYHFENSRFRAVESRYGVIRAAWEGTSAIVDARGIVHAEYDHLKNGPGVVVANLPLYRIWSPYSYLGNWPAWLSMIVFGLWAVHTIATHRRSLTNFPQAH